MSLFPVAGSGVEPETFGSLYFHWIPEHFANFSPEV